MTWAWIAGEAEGVARFPVERAGAEDASLMHGLHGGLAVLVGRAEEDLAVPGDAFDVKDFAGDEAFEEVVGLEIAELVEDGPERVGGFDFADADGGGVGAGLQEPGAGDVAEEAADVVVVEDGGELRDGNAALPGADTHGELVAEVAGEGFAHAGKAHVFAQQRGYFEVELVEGDDAVESVFAGEVADGVQDLLGSEVLRHGDEFGDGVARPVGVLELVDGEENDVDAEAGDLLEEGLALFVGADAENRRLLLLIGHAGSSWCGNEWAFGSTVADVVL